MKNDREIFETPNGIGGFLPPEHPGMILAEELHAQGVDTATFASQMGVTEEQIADITLCKTPITEQMAGLLGSHIGTGPEFWNNLQRQYDEALARSHA